MTNKIWRKRLNEDNKVGNISAINTLHILRLIGMGIMGLGVNALFKHNRATESWLCRETFDFCLYVSSWHVPFDKEYIIFLW